MSEKTERNIAMYRAWKNGTSIQKLSIEHKIKVKTIRSIVKRYEAKEEQGLILNK